jgi:hypothetical protein
VDTPTPDPPAPIVNRWELTIVAEAEVIKAATPAAEEEVE